MTPRARQRLVQLLHEQPTVRKFGQGVVGRLVFDQLRGTALFRDVFAHQHVSGEFVVVLLDW